MPRSPSRRVRLNLYLARAAGGSRREADGWIRAGRVRVNGIAPGSMGHLVDPSRDLVTLDGRRLALPIGHRYFAYYKPRGLLVSRRAQAGRPTVARALDSTLGPTARGLQPVGRLDLRSEGLLLLTDDGRLAEALLHPSTGLLRRYRVWVEPVPDAAAIRAMRAGTREDGVAMVPTAVFLEGASGEVGVVLVDLREGKKREVRHLARHAGLRVLRLLRYAFGPVRLQTLSPGSVRPLTKAELAALQREAARFDRARIARARSQRVVDSKSARGDTRRRVRWPSRRWNP